MVDGIKEPPSDSRDREVSVPSKQKETDHFVVKITHNLVYIARRSDVLAKIVAMNIYTAPQMRAGLGYLLKNMPDLPRTLKGLGDLEEEDEKFKETIDAFIGLIEDDKKAKKMIKAINEVCPSPQAKYPSLKIQKNPQFWKHVMDWIDAKTKERGELSLVLAGTREEEIGPLISFITFADETTHLAAPFLPIEGRFLKTHGDN